MPSYLVIAQLDEPQKGDEEIFHTKLLSQGMRDLITGPSGKVYRMPMHTYIFDSDLTKKEVRDLVKELVNGRDEDVSPSIYVQYRRAAAWTLEVVAE